GGTSAGSGLTLNVSPATTTTYWVRAEGDCNTTACVSITLTVKTESTDPTGINTDDDNFCPGGSANLTVQGGSLGDGASWEWYTGSCGGTSAGSGLTLNVSPVVTTTYWVRAEGDCNNTACVSITITVKTESTDPTGINTDNDNFCPGESANLTVQGGSLGTGASWEWYTGSCGGTSAGSGLTLNVSPVVTTTYWVRAEGDCNTTACVSITLTVKAESTDPTGINTDNNNFCVGESANLTVQGGSLGDGASWEWYTGSCGGTSAGSGLTLNVSPATTTTYWVRAEGDCDTTACENIALIVYDVPTAFAGKDTMLCYDTPYQILDADTTNSDGVNWEILTGNGSLDDPNILDPEYTPDVSDGGTVVELVLHASGKGSCAESTDTIRITYLSELLVAIGKPTPFYIDSTSTHIDVYIKISSYQYLSLSRLYLKSPLDSIVELKPFCDNIPFGISAAEDVVYRFYNDPLDTSALAGATAAGCNVVSGRYEFLGDWKKKLHGLDPSNGAWRIMIKDSLNYGSGPGTLDQATITFSDTNYVGGFEFILYADSSINLNINDWSSGPAAETEYTLSLTGLTTSCFGECDATAVATGTGGLQPYLLYEWSASLDFSSPFATTDTVNLCVGKYYVQVTDSHGCTAIDSISVLEPPEIYITDDTVVHNLCYGDTIGKVMLEFAGGTGALQYTYNGTDWYNSGDTIFNLGAATYTFTIEDATGCTKDTVITITEPTQIDITTNVTEITCYGADDGEIEIIALGGTPGYTYSIDSAYNWFPGNIFTPLPQDTFYIAVQDAAGCIQFGDTVEMIYPDTITIDSVWVTPVICDGSTDDGTITIFAESSSYSNLDYSINNGADFYQDSLFTGLSGGTYQIIVQDPNGCSKTLDSLVTVNGPIIITYDSIVHNDCYGDTTGVIKLEFSGGTGVLQYSHNGTDWYNSGDTIKNLPAAIYTVSIMDGLGCTKDTIIEITEPNPINITTNVTDITCYGADDGQIEIIATDGTPGYTYSVDSAFTWVAGNIFTPLAVDTFYIAVQDAAGCIQFGDTVEMLNPDTITIDSVWVTPVICDGSADDGTITVFAHSGSGDLDYSINNGVDFYADSLFTGLAGGDYQIVVENANGCSKPLDSLVTINGPIVISYDSVVHNVCYGDTGGVIKLEFTGGSGALQYSHNGTDWYNSGDTIKNLGAAIYTVSIMDAIGCTKDTIIEITEPNPIDISTSVTEITCYGADDGQIVITATDGTPGYQYSVDSAFTWNAGNTFTALAQDTFYIAVQDAAGCIRFGDTIELLYPDTISIDSITIIPTTCFPPANDGGLTIYASGGVGPLEYSLDNITYQSSNLFTGLPAGDTTVYVRDNCGFKMLDTLVTVTGPIPITIDVVTIFDVNTCYNENTGQISITPGGGSGIYEYSINGGSTYQVSNTFTGLYAGPYVINVIDDDGCTSPDSTVNVDQPLELLITDFTIINASECNADLTGSITVIAAGGTGALDYNVDGGAFQSSATFAGLDVGTHTFIVRDVNGCTATDDTSIITIDPMDASFTVTDVTCNGLSNGSLTVVPTDGLPPYFYLWETGATTATINTLDAGFYSVTITDSNLPTSCEFIGTEEVQEPEVLSINPEPRNKRCININSLSRNFTNSLGRVVLDVDGGTPGYFYTWTGPPGFTPVNNDTIINLQPGLYSVTVTDSKGCNTTYSTTLIEDNTYDILSYTVEFEDTSVCWNDSVIFENTFTGNVDTVFFQKSEFNGTNWVATQWSVEVSGSPTTIEHSIEGRANFDYIRATNEYCYQETTDILVEYFPDYELDIIDELDGNSVDDTIYLKGVRSGQLVAYVTDLVSVISYVWSPTETLSNPNAQSTAVTPEESGYYTVIATSDDECVDTSMVYLEFIPAITPNEGFSPNGDGINDYWVIKYIDKFQNNQVIIFNRWGAKVYDQTGYINNDPDRSWNGKAKNGKDLPSGTYYYVIILNEENFDPISGPITIIR
ncbi:gliding motility-associated C-terminal domain-containing protein, partial [Bacteroidota bacterium]